MIGNAKRVFIITAVIVVAGAGCAKVAPLSPVARGPESIQKMSPKDAAHDIRFKQGSSFEIHQSALKVQGEFIQGDPKLSQRVVTLNEFKPNVEAKLQWTLQQKVETDEYKKAVEAFQNGATTTEPKPTYGLLVTAGSLTAINLKITHKLFLPSLWPEGEGSARSASAVWASKSIFEELSRTRVSTVYMNVWDDIGDLAAGNEDLRKAIAFLRMQADKAAVRTDLDLMKAEGDVADMRVAVNGKDATVQVLKARNWYGEMTVLNNPENPLILKFSLNPPLTGEAIEASQGMNLLKELLSFEVTRIDL